MRLYCWLCGNQLMYVKGVQVYAELTVDGHAYKVHKDCKRWNDDGELEKSLRSFAKKDIQCVLEDAGHCIDRMRKQ